MGTTLDTIVKMLKKTVSQEAVDVFLDYLTLESIVKMRDENRFNLCCIKDLVKNNIVESDIDDVISLIMQMSATMREKSHGAVQMAKVYIPTSLYSIMASSVGADSKASCKIAKATVVADDSLENSEHIYGIGISKFKYVPSELMIIGGKLTKEMYP